jgi:hypothetical protein
MGFLFGAVGAEDQLKKLLPGKLPILGTIPPITSKADVQREKMLVLQTVLAFMLTCAALIFFLHRVKPIL